MEAYEESLIGNSAARLKQVVRQGARHWREGASQILETYRKSSVRRGITLDAQLADRLRL